MHGLINKTLVSVCLAASTASMAIAQTPADSNTPPASSATQGTSQRAFSRPTERAEARLAYLKTALKITAAQQAQWDAYADVVRKNAQDREQRVQSRQSGERSAHHRASAIERLERAQSFHAAAVTRINQLLGVQKPLYAALSSEQQKVADVLLNRKPRFMGRPHGHGGFGRT